MKPQFWFHQKKSKIKKTLSLFGLFLLFFAIAFTAINWSAVKFQVDYKIHGAGAGEKQISEQYLQQLTEAPDKFYEGPDRLIIPKINVEAPLVYADTFDEKKIQEYLREGLVHYVDTAKPGEMGNAVIVGHSSMYQWDTNSYGRVFALLNELEEGDAFYFIADHKRYQYVVSKKFTTKPSDVSVLSQEGLTKPTTTLISCWPIGTYWKRLVVQAELVND